MNKTKQTEIIATQAKDKPWVYTVEFTAEYLVVMQKVLLNSTKDTIVNIRIIDKD